MFLFGRQLEAWTQQELVRFKGRRKSICLPGGMVGFRKVRGRTVIDDLAAVLRWAKANCPEAVVTKEYISRSVLNAHATTTGEIPDAGVRVEPERQAFFVR